MYKRQARIRTAIRHSRAAFLNQGGAPTGTFVSGGLTIDYDKHRVFVDGTDAGLTQNEYKLSLINIWVLAWESPFNSTIKKKQARPQAPALRKALDSTPMAR